MPELQLFLKGPFHSGIQKYVRNAAVPGTVFQEELTTKATKDTKDKKRFAFPFFAFRAFVVNCSLLIANCYIRVRRLKLRLDNIAQRRVIGRIRHLVEPQLRHGVFSSF